MIRWFYKQSGVPYVEEKKMMRGRVCVVQMQGMRKKNDEREKGFVILRCIGIHVYSREDEDV